MPSTNFIYVVFIQPLMILPYLWMLLSIKCSRLQELKSPFFTFFTLSGVAACLNVVMILLKGVAEIYLMNFTYRDVVFNFIIFGSHLFSLAHTLGTMLVIATRFTAIAYPHGDEDIWTRRRRWIATAFMYIIPAVLFSFMVFFNAEYRENVDGTVIYFGGEILVQKISKGITAMAYFIFVLYSIGMCVASIVCLRKENKSNKNLLKHQERLIIYTVFTSAIHLFKSWQQMFWFYSLFFEDESMFRLATTLYNIANPLTTFVPPLLLILMSSVVREAVKSQCCCRSKKVHRSRIAPFASPIASPMK